MCIEKTSLAYVRDWIHKHSIFVFKFLIYTTIHDKRNSQVICLTKTEGHLLSNYQYHMKGHNNISRFELKEGAIADIGSQQDISAI